MANGEWQMADGGLLSAIGHKLPRFLAANPRHPSLRIHPIRGSSGYWEFYIDDKYRCVFRREGNMYYLVAAGSHQVVDEFARR